MVSCERVCAWAVVCCGCESSPFRVPVPACIGSKTVALPQRTRSLKMSFMEYLRRSPSVRALCATGTAGLLLIAAGVRADEVHLQSGSTIEGRASRDGDTVVVRVESGVIRLPADSVQRIDKSEASDDIAQRRRAALAPRDIRGRLELAAYCREHDLRATERALLEEVIALEPNHAQARRLLGYVRTEQGWVERRAQEQRARDADNEAWLARERAREREQARAEVDRERALETRQLELEAARLRAARQHREEQMRARDSTYYGFPYAYGYVPGVVYSAPPRTSTPRDPATENCLPGGCAAAPPAPQPVSPIPGVRHPRDTTWALPGVKNPREWTR